MKKKSTKHKSFDYVKKSTSGITLIALVITIIVLLILAGASLSAVLGENGIITRAETAAETSRINAAKEQIELAVIATHMDRMKDKQPFDLEYIKDNIGKELGGLEIIGTHGSPIDRVYVKYEDENFMIDEEGNVIHIGDVDFNTIPDLAIVPDQVVTGVDKVVLTLSTEVELGQITKIVTPTGEITGGNGTYTVEENGTYEFTVYTDQETEIKKTVTINNIKEDGYDLTGLMTGIDGGHNCIYKTSYDKTSHWSECIFCGEKVSVVEHTYTTTWATGEESCHYGNSYTNVCECGYKETGHKPCVWDGVSYSTRPALQTHNLKCSVCKSYIIYQYYMNEYGVGELKTSPGDVICADAEGIRIGCQNVKECTTCQYNYTSAYHNISYNEDNVVFCSLCEIEFGTMSVSYSSANTAPNTYTFLVNINLKNGAVLHSTNPGSIRNTANSVYETTSNSFDYVNEDRTEGRITKSATFLNTYKIPYSGYITVLIVIEGKNYNVISPWTTFYPDLQVPVISKVSQEDIETLDGWTTSKKITISGTENYCDTVTITVKDDAGATVYTGSAVVTNNAYSLSFTPALEADKTGRTFTVTVTDACDNKTETTFTVQKVDSKVPTLSSATGLISDWAIRKNLSLEIIDEGVGNVEVAFNDTTSYEKLTETDNKFLKSYKFIGDLYQEIEASIYIKDGLGNLLTKTITIGKVDNTSPRITNVSETKSGSTTIVTVNADDLNTTLNVEGSKIAGYAITRSKEMPSAALYQTSNTFNIDTAGTYYIWVRDSVGNLAKIEEIVVE